MSEAVLRFYQLAEVCRERAAQTRNPIDADAWLKLAEDWLELTRADGQGRDTSTSRAASDQRQPEDPAARVLPQVCPR